MKCLTKIYNWLKTGNNALWLATFAMMLLGTLSICFVSPVQEFRNGIEQGFFFKRYIAYLLLGTGLLIACSKMSKKFMLRVCYVLGGLGLLLLLWSIIDHIPVKGSVRYAFVLGLSFNPYVLMLPAYVVLVSNWLSKDTTNNKKFWIWLSLSVLTLFIAMAAFLAPYVIMAETYLILFMFLTMLARKKMPAPFYTSMAIAFGLTIAGIIAVMTTPYMQTRIVAMLQGGDYLTAAAHKAIHASSLIGSNAESLQALAGIPDVHTDFMFAGVVAKFGVLAGVLLLLLYTWTTLLMMKKLDNTSLFYKLMCGGVLVLFMMGNISTSLGGLQFASYLPFMSYSGSMLLVFCMLFGFVLAKPEKE